MEINVINNLIKFLVVFVMAFNVFAGGDDRDQAYYENLDEELAAFEAKLVTDQAADEMMDEIKAEMDREEALAIFQQKLADERAASAAKTAAYRSKLAREAEMTARMAELAVEKEISAFEAKLVADALAEEMMAEIEREMALAAFQQKIADEKAAASAATTAYRANLAKIASDEMMAEILEEAGEEVIGVIEEVVVTEAAHEACKYALNLSESNTKLFEIALADGTLFNKGPQDANGTQFTANRWDAYANCVSNYVNPF